MMNKRIPVLLAAALATFTTGPALGQNHGHEHHAFPRDIDAFHSLLAPIWHARPGPQRSADACAKAAEMDKSARAIRAADATPLIAAVTALAAQCKADPGGIDAAFFDVHEAFHKLIDARAPAARR
jgi:hypothetical protein